MDNNAQLEQSTQNLPDFSNVVGNVNRETLQEILAKAIGRYVQMHMLIGTSGMVVREGILLQVGPNYFIIFEESDHTAVTCDLFSLRFAKIFRMGERPNRNNNAITNIVIPGPANNMLRTDNNMPNYNGITNNMDMHDRMFNMQAGFRRVPNCRGEIDYTYTPQNPSF